MDKTNIWNALNQNTHMQQLLRFILCPVLMDKPDKHIVDSIKTPWNGLTSFLVYADAFPIKIHWVGHIKKVLLGRKIIF